MRDALIRGIYLSLKDGYAMLNQPVPSTFLWTVDITFVIFIFTEKYLLLMERVQIFTIISLIIEFREILVKLKNIAHAISVE
jgi:hypothetical protein